VHLWTVLDYGIIANRLFGHLSVNLFCLSNQARQQIHPSHQRLLDQRNAQMEHRRQMSANFYQNRQTSFGEYD
jgi:hypothetical protein